MIAYNSIRMNRMHIREPRNRSLLRAAWAGCMALFMLLALAGPAASSPTQRARYIFLFIGDGMGMNLRRTAEIYQAALHPAWQPALWMNALPAQGLTTTQDASSSTTDSAAAATAIASGQKTRSGVIGMDSQAAAPLTSLAEIAHARGMRVGIITNVPINHATPAAFYAHVPSRTQYDDIGQSLARSGFEYFAGGAFLQSAGPSGNETGLTALAQAAGYTIVEDRAALLALQPGSGKVLALAAAVQDGGALTYAIDRAPGGLSLLDYTRKGIELLDNPDGFLLVAEGGKIDWAAHANDAATALREVLDLDSAVREAVAFYYRHPEETLIVVTSDHDTGGLGLFLEGGAFQPYITRLAAQSVSLYAFGQRMDGFRETYPGASFSDAQGLIEASFGPSMVNSRNQAVLENAFALSMQREGLHADEETGASDPLGVELSTRLAYKAGILWNTGSHTSLPVQTSALGAGSVLFNGFYDNTEIFSKIVLAAGF